MFMQPLLTVQIACYEKRHMGGRGYTKRSRGMARKCRACGHENPPNTKVCPKCRSSLKPRALILGVVVVVTLVLIVTAGYAVLVGVLRGDPPLDTTPAATYSTIMWRDMVRATVSTISKTDVPWSDVIINLTDGNGWVEWSPMTDDLDNGSITAVNLTSTGAVALGDVCVYCWVSDISGDGYVGVWDFVQVVAAGDIGFSPTTYTMALVYEPTGETMGTGIEFTG
jgi:hypothetical protein